MNGDIHLSFGSERSTGTEENEPTQRQRMKERSPRSSDDQEGNSVDKQQDISPETRVLREWQRGLTQVFKNAVLPATQKIYDLMKSHRDTDEEVLEERLQEYYRSISRERFHEREIVWGKDERKIETLLLSPKVQGAPARFLRCQYQAATGAGKTKSMLEMIRIHMESRTRANKKIQPLYCVVEPTLNLVQQTYQASLQLDGLDCFCVCSDGSVPSKSKQEAASQAKYRSRPMLIITTKHSAAGFRQNDGADGSGLLDLFSQQSIIIDMLLLDECHLLAGESEGKIQKETYIRNCHSIMLKVSFTATPRALPRSDEHSNGFPSTSDKGDDFFYCQNSVDGVFGPVMYRYTYGDALKDDVVAPFNLALMDNTLPEADILTEFLQSRVKAWDEENSSTSEGWPLIESGVNVDPLDASTEKQRPFDEMTWKSQRMMMMLRILHEIATGRQTHVVAYCARRITRAKMLCKLMRYLCKEQIESIKAGRSLLGFKMGSTEYERLSILHENCYYHVSGKSTSCSSDKNELKPFQDAKVAFLSNIDKLTAGTDIPQITGIFFPDIKGCSDPQTLIQCIGRGTRIFPGKERCTVFLPCFVPYIKLTPESDLPEEAIAELEKKKKKKNWEGSFSKMATDIYNFIKRNEDSDENRLNIECLPSRNIFEGFTSNSTRAHDINTSIQERHQPNAEARKTSHMSQVDRGRFEAMRRPSESSRLFRNGPIKHSQQETQQCHVVIL